MIRSLALAAILFSWPHARAVAQDANRDEIYTKTDVGGIVQTLDRRTGEFKEQFDKAVEHSLIDGTKLEDRAKHRADDLHDSAKKLRDVFNDKKDKNNPAVREMVDRTLAAASDVNRVMTTHRFTERVQHNWDLLRADLSALANVYELPPL